MFISFYLTNDIYHNGDIGRYRKRLIRLEIPLIVWNLIYALIVILEGNSISASDLFGGLIWGHGTGLDTPLWFLSSQILITFFVFGLFLAVEGEKTVPVSLIIIILVFVMEYTGTITTWFETANSDYKYTISYAFESIPYALSGMMFKKLESSICKISRVWLYILIGIIALVGAFMLQVDKCVGVGYHSLSLYLYAVGVSFIVIRCGQLISEKNMETECVNRIASCMMGVYCIHMLLYEHVYRWINIEVSQIDWKFGGLITFAICTVVSFVMGRFTNKNRIVGYLIR